MSEEKNPSLPADAEMIDKKHFVIKGEKYRGHRQRDIKK